MKLDAIQGAKAPELNGKPPVIELIYLEESPSPPKKSLAPSQCMPILCPLQQPIQLSSAFVDAPGFSTALVDPQDTLTDLVLSSEIVG
jgi:hypothetical protein